jgi:hypothetical protein
MAPRCVFHFLSLQRTKKMMAYPGSPSVAKLREIYVDIPKRCTFRAFLCITVASMTIIVCWDDI